MNPRLSVAILVLAGLLAGCKEKEVILQGTRLDTRADLGTDGTAAVPAAAPAARDVPLHLPAAVANAEWTHRGGSAQHRSAPLVLSPSPVPLWSVSIGKGEDHRHRITADPVVAGGRIFTLDSRARVAATSTAGAPLWSVDLTPSSDSADDASGGGLAFGAGKLFATSAFGELVAFDPASGKVLWRQRFDAPVTGAPTVEGNVVYVIADDASGWAIDTTTGKVRWQIPAVPARATMTGGSSPSVEGRMALYPFGSGQLVGVLKAGGTPMWTAVLGGTRLGKAYALVTDIAGDPVISGNTAYVGTTAGTIVAVDITTGEELWTADVGAMSPIWMAGGSLFSVSDDSRLVRVGARDGSVIWSADLPYYEKTKPKRRRNVTPHFGPVLAGGRLLLASGDGLIRFFDPVNGTALGSAKIGGAAAVDPVVAGGTLYIVTEDGKLRAFR